MDAAALNHHAAYRVWVLRGRAGALARWRVAAEADNRHAADRLADAVRAQRGRSAVLLVEYRPALPDAIT